MSDEQGARLIPAHERPHRPSEPREGSVIFTTESDFRMYRKNGRQVVPLIMPG